MNSSNDMRNGTPTFASLFSGCGGFDLGFAARGFRSKGAFDCNPEAVENFARNVDGRVNQVDLTQGIPDEQSLFGVDALIAGPSLPRVFNGWEEAGQRPTKSSPDADGNIGT